ncbi:MAG: hypothetical protein ACREVI_10835 [Steroidobacteraceae bacterium]
MKGPFLATILVLATSSVAGDDMTIEEVRNSIRVGMTKHEIEAYLSSSGITYSEITGKSLRLEADLPSSPTDVASRIVGIIPETS